MDDFEDTHARLMAKLDRMPSTGFLYAMTAFTIVGILGGFALFLWLTA